jgi:hypothetical protein
LDKLEGLLDLRNALLWHDWGFDEVSAGGDGGRRRKRMKGERWKQKRATGGYLKKAAE